LAGKLALFLFLLIFTFPIYAESFPEEEDSLEWVLLFEELLTLDELPKIEDDFFDEEEDILSEENTLSEEDILVEEDTLNEEEPLSEEDSLSEEETLVEEDTLSEEETLAQEDTFSEEETLAEEFFFDDEDSFFFEGPGLVFEVPVFETRSFDELFPSFSARDRRTALSNNGIRHFFTRNDASRITPNPELEIDLFSGVMEKNPSHLIEALVVVPYNEKEFDLLDIFYALGRIENIKDYFVTINDYEFYPFTESTRLVSNRNRRAAPDPLPATTLPFSETIYARLKEYSMGNLFLKIDTSVSIYGLTYKITNFTDIMYYIIPVMKAERYLTIIYLEPIKEGVLIYSVTGFYLPNFIAERVNITSSVNRRVQIFTNWIIDGLRIQEKVSFN